MSALVLGATGRVGRRVVAGLAERGVAVRAVSRHPDAAGVPAGVEAAAADLSEPQTLVNQLGGVAAVFLVWPFLSADGADEVVESLAAPARRIVYPRGPRGR